MQFYKEITGCWRSLIRVANPNAERFDMYKLIYVRVMF